jgi:hypothetical protein
MENARAFDVAMSDWDARKSEQDDWHDPFSSQNSSSVRIGDIGIVQVSHTLGTTPSSG